MHGSRARGGKTCAALFIAKLRGKEVRQMLFHPQESGQGVVEYALILVLVVVVVIAIQALARPVIGNVFSNIVKNV
jgi:pilus assembly protein Flp/PilA